MSVHDLHSMRADRLAARTVVSGHDMLEAALSRKLTAREDCAAALSQIVEVVFVDGSDTDLHVVIAGIDDDVWDDLDAVHVTAASKRETFRDLAGRPLLTVSYVRAGERRS